MLYEVITIPEENPDLEGPAAFSYDPATKVLTAGGKKYEILALFLAVRDLYASLPFFNELSYNFV